MLSGNMTATVETLTEPSLKIHADRLAGHTPEFQSVLAQYGYPPLWDRTPGFSTLIHIILEQQVSLASARACFQKLNDALPVLEPASFLALSNEQLHQIGFSRQKTHYCRNLSRAILDGTQDLELLQSLSDEDVLQAMTRIVGIGPWTANIYLLMALRRPDIWPAGDLALELALQRLFGLSQRPDREAFETWGAGWKPYRSVAARILWHYYLSR